MLCIDCHCPHPEMTPASRRRSEAKKQVAKPRRDTVVEPHILETVKSSFFESVAHDEAMCCKGHVYKLLGNIKSPGHVIH